MRSYTLKWSDEALTDLADAWSIVEKDGGEERANRLVANIEAFCVCIAEIGKIGTAHENRYPGLRSVGVPEVKRATVLFIVKGEVVTIARVGYLGRNVWASFEQKG